MKILHLVAPAQVGGLETVVRLLATGHRAMGHDVHVAAVVPEQQNDHPFINAITSAGVGVSVLEVPGRAYLRERRLVRSLCQTMRPDIVHSHGYRPDVIDAGVARKLGIPIVTTVHGFTGGGRKNRLYERLQRFAFRRFDAVVAVSRPLVQELTWWGVSPTSLRFIPNAFYQSNPPLDRAAARQALGLPPDAFVVGWVGRLSQEKGGDILVDAFARLSPHPPTIHASIIGDGPDRHLLEERARSLGFADRITWHGTMNEAGRFFTAFDAFVLSSRTEGTPMVLFEAMATGVPIIASQVGGVPDVVTPSEALLIPSNNAGALASAIGACQADGSAAAQRAAVARAKLAREFQVEPWLVRYEQLYRELRSSVSGSL